MTADASHSAAGQALGYFHQCMWALVELGGRAATEPRIELRLETLDDIEFANGGQPTELLQTKHHTHGTARITAHSVDLWRTLNVWMDLPSFDTVVLRLVTTQELSETSGLAKLRAGDQRDPLASLVELQDAARTSDNKTTAPWRAKFLSLTDTAQAELLERIVVDDGSLPASRIDAALTRTFRYAYPPGRDEVFFKLLKGWWAGIAVQLLSRTLAAVTGDDLITQVSEITDQLKSDRLPVDPTIRQKTDESIADIYKDRPFVRQLLWIALDEKLLWNAIRDYHRSFTQRSFWFRYQLLAESELNQFAFNLYDEWEQVFDSRVAAMRRDSSPDEEIVGQQILETIALQSRARLRQRFDEPWFNRGLFHALADGELGYRVGWHPDFEAKLEEMLSGVAT